MEKSDIESGHVDRGDNGSSDMDDSSRRLLDSIRAMVETLRPPLSSNCCIYRVPKKIRELNEAAYTPHLVSIGPFHNGKVGLQNMEKHKVRYLDKILQLPGVRLKRLVIFIKECEERVRSCYAETIDLKYDKFLNMVLLDGCFIIKLFLMNYNDYFEDEEDKILRKFLFRDDIVGDLFLLENQLPFFLLEGLYNIAFSTALNPPISFLELSCKFFKDYNQQEIPIQGEEVKHFTDLLRTFLLPSSEKKRSPLKHIETSQFSKSATDLKEAGVKFKVGSSKCLIDVQFSDGELEIPFLKFEDITESYFRNIMALE